MKHRLPKGCFLILLLISILSCIPRTLKHESLNAVLWVQTSAEYEASVFQAYRSAREKLDMALGDPKWTAAIEQLQDYSQLPPGIIMDIDETVLDNSIFHAQLVKDGGPFSLEKWKEWVQRVKAQAVPGSLQFVRYARSRGVEVFYITNREADLEDETRRNLEKLGFRVKSDPDTLLMKEERGWSSDKTSRREFVANDYRILLLIGDDLNDFVSGAASVRAAPEDRKYIVEKHISYWGKKWILLPNPVYGSWERSLYGFQGGLPYRERLKQQLGRLVTFE